MLAIIGYLLGACSATGWYPKSSDRLDVASGRLATHYNLPEIVLLCSCHGNWIEFSRTVQRRACYTCARPI